MAESMKVCPQPLQRRSVLTALSSQPKGVDREAVDLLPSENVCKPWRWDLNGSHVSLASQVLRLQAFQGRKMVQRLLGLQGRDPKVSQLSQRLN